MPLNLLQHNCRDRCRWYDLVLIRGIGVVVGLLGLLFVWHWGTWLLGFDKPHPRAWMHPYLIIGFPILGVSYLLIRLNRVIINLLTIGCFLLSILVSFTHPLLCAILLLVGTRLMCLLRKPTLLNPMDDPLELNASTWIQKQVETHLLFGSSTVALWMVIVIFLCLLSGTEWLALAKNHPAQDISGDLFNYLKGNLICLGIVLLFLRVKPPAYGWLLVKIVLVIICFMNLGIGAPVSFSKGQSDAWVFLALGLIWLPSFEFSPFITPHQKYLTILRSILTLPAIYLGISSGYWH